MKFNLVVKYDKNFLKFCKKFVIKSINIYSFYAYVFWHVYFFQGLKRFKKSKMRFDNFIGQIVGLYPKHIGISVLNYSYIDGVEIFRLVFLCAKGLINFYEVPALKNLFFLKNKKKQKYCNKKRFVRLNMS